MKRERVQLAQTYKEKKHFVNGWFVSEKLDGMRAYWDGGITRGMIKSDVPWANCAKDDRLVNVEVSTGLWSRLGNVIHAPDYWLDHLPACPLDGELFMGRDIKRQDLLSRVKRLSPLDADWEPIQMWCYAMPSYMKMFPSHGDFVPEQCNKMIGLYIPSESLTFRQEYYLLKKVVDCPVAKVLEQTLLPTLSSLCKTMLNRLVDDVVKSGGEGVVIRNPDTGYECCRSHNLLKYKPFDDAEATIGGFVSGRETDKGSRLLGKMGAMIVDYNGVTLQLSGFTDAERVLDGKHHQSATRAYHWAASNPGTECPNWISCLHFKRGERVTFKYRGLSADGVPQEARYWRKDERL